MRDERRPGLDGPGRMVKSRGLDRKVLSFVPGILRKFGNQRSIVGWWPEIVVEICSDETLAAHRVTAS